MEFDPTKAIWVQLVTEFSRRIATGDWAAGDRVAPVRELAAEFGVNPNTVQKSLTELDRLGLSTADRTAGRYVTTDTRLVRETRLALAAEAADTFLVAAEGLGLTASDAMDLVQQRWDAHREEN